MIAVQGIILLIILGVAWVAITQILIPVMADRPMFPMVRGVAKVQHEVAVAKEEVLLTKLKGQSATLKSEASLLQRTFPGKVKSFRIVRMECDNLSLLLNSPMSGNPQWHFSCLATFNRLKAAMDELDTQHLGESKEEA